MAVLDFTADQGSKASFTVSKSVSAGSTVIFWLSDEANNAWSSSSGTPEISSTHPGTGRALDVWKSENVSAGTFTATVTEDTATVRNAILRAVEITGAAASGAVEASNANNGIGTSVQAGATGVTATAGATVLTLWAFDRATTLTISGYTQSSQITQGGGPVVSEYDYKTSAGASETGSGTVSPNAFYAAAILSIKMAASTPVITAPTATVNGSTTALVGATVPIATGTLRAVITNTTTVPSTAQVIAGQDHTGSTSGVLSGSLAITSSGVKTFNVGGLTSGTTRHVYLALEDAGGNSAVVYAGVIYPGTWRVASDVTTAGWTVTGAATHAAAINEDTAGDAAYTTSPALTSTPSSLTMALDESRPAGTYTERIRVNVSSGTGFARVVALNNAGTVQGQTADQAINSTLTTYTLTLTQAGTATRLRLDVWI
jgi:hypothetical protein